MCWGLNRWHWVARILIVWVFASLQDSPLKEPVAPQSPDLSSPDFFLWGYLEERVYKYKPHTLEALKDKIQLVLANIENDVLQQMLDSIEHNVQLCL